MSNSFRCLLRGHLWTNVDPMADKRYCARCSAGIPKHLRPVSK